MKITENLEKLQKEYRKWDRVHKSVAALAALGGLYFLGSSVGPIDHETRADSTVTLVEAALTEEDFYIGVGALLVSYGALWSRKRVLESVLADIAAETGEIASGAVSKGPPVRIPGETLMYPLGQSVIMTDGAPADGQTVYPITSLPPLPRRPQ